MNAPYPGASCGNVARLLCGFAALLLGACATGGGGLPDAGGGGGVDGGVTLMDAGSPALDAGPVLLVDAGPIGSDAGPIVATDAGPVIGTDGGPPASDAGPIGTDAGPLTPDAGPSCESPCRLVSPQCGCGASSCDIDDTGARVCRPVGSGVEGSECDLDSECGLGLSCYHDGFFGYCARFCEDDSHCTGGSGSRCLEALPDAPTVDTCTVHCDPVAGGGCAVGFGCDIYLHTGAWYTTCREAFPSSAYDSCVDERDCDDGFFCAATGHGSECLRACEYPSGTGCLGGEACNRFGDMPSLDGVEYGWCHS